MKIRYFPDTDTLYINLRDKPSTETEEISEEVIVDFDAEGSVVGITIDHATQRMDSLNIETIFPSSIASSN